MSDIFEAALPDRRSDLRVRGPEGPVELFRDALGIPHVRARSETDAFFGQGFAHAQDRLWQMEYDRIRAAGRLASIVGTRGLTLDVFVRRMGVEAAARADVEAMDPEARGVLEAYVAGVNAFIESTRAFPVEFALLGIEPEPWLPWHPAAVLKVRHVLMGTYDSKLWRARLLRAMGPSGVVSVGSGDGRTDTLIVPPGVTERLDARAVLEPGALALAPAEGGSNNWAVAGSRTASGSPIVAGDPHRALEVPGVYYQNHIACPSFDSVGLSMPGVPGIFHFGHNGDVAWCITHAMADTQDLFVERFDERGRFLRGDTWHEPERSVETVAVFGGASERVEVVRTASGPVMFGDPASGSAMTMRWTGTDRPNLSLATLLPILRSRTVDELDEAMRPWVDPCNSVVMADVHGTVGYLHRGRVPVRSRANAWLPVPAWTGEHDWRGDVPFEELPRVRDPEEGFIVTANNRVTAASYPHHLGLDYAAPHRANRIIARLRDLRGATVDDMAAVHADAISIASGVFREVAGRCVVRGRAAEMRDLLVAWDGSMAASEAAPAVYAAVRDELAGMLVEREPLARAARDLDAEDPYPTPARQRLRSALPRLIAAGDTAVLGGSSWEEAIAEALERAAGTLTDAMGPDRSTWRWDRLHLTQARHPLSARFPEHASRLDPPAIPLEGDGECVLAGSAESGFGVLHSSVARYAFDLGDRDASAWIVPLGASGHPADLHVADQQRAWSAVRMERVVSKWPDVERSAGTRQTLAP